jgi:hypothetical protein
MALEPPTLIDIPLVRGRLGGFGHFHEIADRTIGCCRIGNESCKPRLL